MRTSRTAVPSPSTWCPSDWGAAKRGIHTIDMGRLENSPGDAIRALTDGRGPDSVIDAVGMEAHGSPVAKFAQQATAVLPMPSPSECCRPRAWTG
ncbi:S-(hydroxymethyl)glutathione dehydrogenase [Mycobacterium triplex]|uniref:S-(Hydroxymethyl)glutathione dehydrogenase n=1 Tax=Mycobacterium triplex TaxID=47839 RepID=A0A024JV05_9MYCO|nr:S-(hydroxymethyl)glutathione dehydrogenase [Mycobacterium triplex]